MLLLLTSYIAITIYVYTVARQITSVYSESNYTTVYNTSRECQTSNTSLPTVNLETVQLATCLSIWLNHLSWMF